MTDLRQAAQALLNRWDSPLWKNGSTADAIADLRTALEQQAEPVAGNTLLKAFLAAAKEAGVTHLQQAEPVQETEAFGFVTVRRLSQRFENHHDQYQFYPAGQIPYLDNVDECHTVYTAPPQRKPLTDEQLDDIAVVARRGNLHDLRIAIEAAHGIKEGA